MIPVTRCKKLPKPATGEWTAGYVSEIAMRLGNASQNVADAHNAALAAQQIHNVSAQSRIENLEQQLTAERAKIWREAPDQPDVQEAVIKKLDLVHRHAIEKALAAERERLREHWEGNLRLAHDQTERKLAAEREKVRELVDALKDQAEMTAYYNGKSKEHWENYLTPKAKASIPQSLG